MINETIKNKIIEIFDKYLDNDYILFLFGSFAANNFDITSDIDLAIYRKEKIPSYIISYIKADIETQVPTLRDFDIVNLTEENINLDLIKNILSKGVLWKTTRNIDELLQTLNERLISLKKQ